MSFTLYGIPTCDTCRRAKKWFADRQIEFTWINTREQSPSTSQITMWVQTLGNKAMRNTSGKSYRSLPPEKKTWSDEQWIDAFTKDPMLLKRPLIEKDNTAVGTGFKGSDDDLMNRFGLS